jgi:hypothetical protein
LSPTLWIALALYLVGVGSGWLVRGTVADAEHAATDRAVEAFRASEARISAALETKLARLKANERVIEREVTKVVDRPVYRNVCLDDDGLRLIEAARDPAGSAGAVPGPK